MLELFIDRVELGQPEGGDESTDQARAGQIDALAKCPTQHRKTNALAVSGELVEKRLALPFGHASRLRPQVDVWMRFGQQLGHLLQIVEAAEKRQVVARSLSELPGDQVHDWRQGRLAMDVARGNLADDMDLQLVGMKRRLDVDPHRIGRHAQQIRVVMPGVQGRRKQHRAARRRQPWADEARRHHVAQAQLRHWPFAVKVALADVEEVLLVEQLSHPAELQQVEIEVLQGAVQALRMIVEIVANASATGKQGLEQFFRRFVVGLIRRQLRVMQGVPLAIDPLQGLLQRLGRSLAHAVERRLVKAGAVHLPPALHQIVRFVHQRGDSPLIRLGQPE
ncbi:hypothetical protein D3C73_731950 [compost metagenome]